MTAYEFIFSEKRKNKITRHLSFWGVYCVINFYAEMDPGSLKNFSETSLYKISFFNLIFSLPATVLSVYAFIYVLMPALVKPKKYIAFMACALLVACLCFIIDYLISRAFLQFFFPALSNADLFQSSMQIAYREAIHNDLAVWACAIGIKLAKNGYVQQIENTKLLKIETENKIKLLKSHIQPEFLLHSLNNLYKKIDKSADEAPEMVLHLSEILSYILYDSADEKTALAKELSAVEHLITIEKMHGNGLEISAVITGNSNNKYITPLLLFSVLQHLFIEKEMGAYNVKSIHTVINVTEDVLHLSVWFANVSDNNRIKAVIKSEVKNLQKTLPSGYLRYDEEANDGMSIKIVLLNDEVQKTTSHSN